jgi:choline dehydrogenase
VGGRLTYRAFHQYAKDADSPRQTARARKEVIVAAGPIKSPQLLQVSGVGPKKLSSALGIESIVDLPVGENFHDHGTVNIEYNSKYKLYHPE